VELQKETSFFERKTSNYQVSTGLFEVENEMPDSGGNTLWSDPLHTP
jgi:hypothetical protein